MNAQLIERIQSCRTLPTLPGVALELLELCRQERVSLQEVGRLIGRDPALAVKILKVVNSAAYGLRRDITTLSHAVTLLGASSVRSLALSFSLVPVSSKTDPGAFDPAAYWRRSILCVVAAHSLGKLAKLANLEELFLPALLQDIGMLVLNQVFGEVYGALASKAEGDHLRLQELEREEFGADHAEVSAWLAAHWNLPEILQIALRGSHDVSLAKSIPEAEPIVRCIALSGWLADIWTSSDTTLSSRRAKEAAREIMGIERKRLESVLADMAEAIPEVSSLFEIELGDAETVNRTLDQAKESLVMVNLQTIQQDVRRDTLTGLSNRAHLDAVLSQEFEQASRLDTPLSLAFCDIDKFKQINDTYRHRAGDRILLAVARTLAGSLRPLDLVGRYGGDEFVLVLPETNTVEAEAVCQRIQREIASQTYPVHSDQSLRVTLSIGCATRMEAGRFDKAEDLLDAADQSLYEAKRRGGNRVVVCHRSPPTSEGVCPAKTSTALTPSRSGD